MRNKDPKCADPEDRGSGRGIAGVRRAWDAIGRLRARQDQLDRERRDRRDRRESIDED